MSFMLTTQQVLERRKTVTRRLGWRSLNPGDVIGAIEKGQGLKKGERVRRLAMIRVISLHIERLDKMIRLPDYGIMECVQEGFPELNPEQFVEMFCRSHPGCTPASVVTRIEFEYVECTPSGRFNG